MTAPLILRLTLSAAPRWVPCPGSVRLEAQFPESDLEPDPEVDAGRASHWAAQEMLNGQVVALGQVAPNDVVLSNEMIDGAEMYYDDVMKTVPGAVLHVEEPIVVSWIGPHCVGIPDCWAFVHDPTTGIATLYVWDYKFGYGYVEVFENWQLLGAVLAILDKLQINGDADNLVRVVMRVVQPRSHHRDGPVREWRVTADKLRARFNIMASSAEEANGRDPKCHPAPSICKDCRGRHACEAITRVGLNGMDMSTTSLPLVLSPMALGNELRRINRALKLLGARQTGLEQEALHALRRGEIVPWFSGVKSSGREAWTKAPEQVITMGKMLGMNLAKPPEPITPAQARKAGMDPNVLAKMSERSPGGLKLVETDGTELRKIFGE